jgi:hypothetical protein
VKALIVAVLLFPHFSFAETCSDKFLTLFTKAFGSSTILRTRPDLVAAQPQLLLATTNCNNFIQEFPTPNYTCEIDCNRVGDPGLRLVVCSTNPKVGTKHGKTVSAIKAFNSCELIK